MAIGGRSAEVDPVNNYEDSDDLRTRCSNSYFGSHKFEPRYDLSPADMSAFKSFKAADPSYMEPLRAKTYVRDVCTKCGKTIERVK